MEKSIAFKVSGFGEFPRERVYFGQYGYGMRRGQLAQYAASCGAGKGGFRGVLHAMKGCSTVVIGGTHWTYSSIGGVKRFWCQAAAPTGY